MISGSSSGHPLAGHGAGVDQDAGAGVGLGHGGGVELGRILGLDDGADRQVEGARELEVALVAKGHRHDGAGAVAHQDVVGDPDRDALVGDGVHGVAAGEDAGAGAGLVGREPFDLGLPSRLLDVGVDLRLAIGGGDLGHQRMLREPAP